MRSAYLICSVVWDSGPVCVGLAALIFSLSGLFVKLLHGHIPGEFGTAVPAVASMP